MIAELVKPQFIETAADFYEVINFGHTPETLVLDFKKDLDGYQVKGKEASRFQQELCRDLSQFANTLGGCLLLGVEEGHNGNKKVAAGIHSLGDFDSRRQWIEQAVYNCLIPSTMPFQIQAIELREGHIIAVNVPAYIHLVWLWDRDARIMQGVRRTNHGKEYLNPDQIEAHLMNSSRACKLAFLRVVSEGVGDRVQLVSGVWAVQTGGPIGSAPLVKFAADVFLGKVGEYECELRVRTQFLTGLQSIHIPYGLIKETWVTTDRQIGIFLNVKLVADRSSNSLTMEIS